MSARQFSSAAPASNFLGTIAPPSNKACPRPYPAVHEDSPPISGGANGSAPFASPSLFSVRGPRQRAQGRRKSLPATTCQRSARTSCYGVRAQFGPRGRNTYLEGIRPRRRRSDQEGASSNDRECG